MKKTLLALMFGAVMVSNAVAASPFQYEDHHDQDHQDHGHDNYNHHDDRDHHDYVIVHDRGNHEGWYHRGGRVPEEYYHDRRYYVDYHTYHLAPPPPEHVWVRSDTGDFLLVAVATGVIADMVINH